MLRATIVGGAGYVGGELARLLVGHPHIRLTQVTSERLAGRFLHLSHPNLRGHHGEAPPLRYRSLEDLEPSDLLFLCLPHGQAAGSMERFAELAETVVDASADFRLRDPALHTATYGEDTVAETWRSRFVYGLGELERERLRGARFISGVGCNATAVNLALWPLARAGLIERVVADLKVGSSEAGARSTASSHHPERSGALRSFAPVGHRHRSEVQQQLGLDPSALYLSATAVDMVRGVLATCHVFPKRPLDDREMWRLYREAYGDESFVRLVRERRGLYRLPEPKVVAGTNVCEVGWAVDEDTTGAPRVVVLAALDNLMKGAAGSALQAVNIARGWPETAGLDFLGLHPY